MKIKKQIKNLLKVFCPNLYIRQFNKYIEKRIKINHQRKLINVKDYPEELSKLFMQRTGRILDLENPKSWTEKIQWLKLYDSTQEKADWTDKIKAKKLAGNLIGFDHVVPLVGNVTGYKSFDDINFENLPDAFVIKTNHASGTNLIVRDKKSFLKHSERDIAKAKFDAWMQMDFGFDDGFELHYSLIDRRILIEEYVPSLKGLIKEYRFLCFNGKVKMEFNTEMFMT